MMMESFNCHYKYRTVTTVTNQPVLHKENEKFWVIQIKLTYAAQAGLKLQIVF